MNSLSLNIILLALLLYDYMIYFIQHHNRHTNTVYTIYIYTENFTNYIKYYKNIQYTSTLYFKYNCILFLFYIKLNYNLILKVPYIH